MTSWSPPSPSTMPTSCRGRAWPRAATSSAGRTAHSPRPMIVDAELDRSPKPRLLAITAASNITGWMPPIDEIIEAAHSRGIPVVVDGAQLAPHRPLPAEGRFRRLERPQDVRTLRRRSTDRPSRSLRGWRPLPCRRRRGAPRRARGRRVERTARPGGSRLAERGRGSGIARRDRHSHRDRLASDHRPRPPHRPPIARGPGGHPGSASARAGSSSTRHTASSLPSSSRASRTALWQPGCRPRTESACGTAASVPTRT